MPWLGVDISWLGGQNTIGRGVKLQWVGADIPWIGGRYTMGMGSIYHG